MIKKYVYDVSHATHGFNRILIYVSSMKRWHFAFCEIPESFPEETFLIFLQLWLRWGKENLQL